jgi:putative ABC transport system permease protein
MLTIMGVALAIGFTVGLLSISEGFMSALDGMLTGSGPDLFIRPKGGSKMPFGMQGTAMLDADLLPVVRGIPGVEFVEPIYQAFSVDGGSTGFGPMMTMVSGMPADDFFTIRPTAAIADGRFFTNDDGNVVVLGGVVAENTNKKVGDKLELISGRKLEVIGIMKKSDEPFDYFAYSPIGSLQKMFRDPGRISYFLVKASADAGPELVSERLAKAFPHLDIQTVRELITEAKKMLSMARAVHFGVSCFALVIGVLFVACTMVMSVSERIREFATLRVIGASKGFVIRMILAESIILSVVGGALGCCIGVALSKLIDLLIGYFVGETFMSALVSPRIFAVGLLISVLIGAFAGLLPAAMIMRRNIADSLRYE